MYVCVCVMQGALLDTHTHTHVRTLAYTHTHTHTHACMHAYVYTEILIYTQNTFTYSSIHTYLYTFFACVCATWLVIRATREPLPASNISIPRCCSIEPMLLHKGIARRTHIHKHARARAHTHTHTHAHTHTRTDRGTMQQGGG